MTKLKKILPSRVLKLFPQNFEPISLFAVEPVLEVKYSVCDTISLGVHDDKNAIRRNVDAVFGLQLDCGITLNQGFNGIVRVGTAVDERLYLLNIVKSHD